MHAQTVRFTGRPDTSRSLKYNDGIHSAKESRKKHLGSIDKKSSEINATQMSTSLFAFDLAPQKENFI